MSRSPCTNFCAPGRVPVKTTGENTENMSAVSEDDRLRRARLPALLDYAFRPMFLAAGSWGVIALAGLAMFFGYVQLPTRFDPLAWHINEMLLGFVVAAVAGFLLTAIPNWTGRLPARGVAAGTALLGLSIFNLGVPAASAIHPLTAGAIAVMILAVLTRVTLGHTGRDLIASRATIAIFVLINVAALARVCASWHTEFMTALLFVAGACWIAALVLFKFVYGPMLLSRRRAS